MFSQLPKSTQAQVLGKQLLRSGTSVRANYREAFRGRSKPELSDRVSDIDRQPQASGSERARAYRFRCQLLRHSSQVFPLTDGLGRSTFQRFNIFDTPERSPLTNEPASIPWPQRGYCPLAGGR